ncbi:MAG: YeeE/YedE family protein [Burkholderiales bacterium]|nr:YeeE/YedE family protein [Burkholderiales bacterium]
MNTAAGMVGMVLWGGFALGLAFGAVAQRSNFCTMGAMSDIVNMNHWGRARMWLLALAVAIAGAAALQHFGQVNLAHSIYRRGTRLPWLSLLVGGTVFGIGMTLAGGCANKNLLRLGGGSLRSLVVLAFMAISAYMTLKGLFGQWRSDWLDPVSIRLEGTALHDASLGQALAAATGLGSGTAMLAVAALLVAALLVFVFKEARFRRNAVQVGSGLALGALVVAGWYLSGHLGHGENPETLEQVYFATNTRTIESLSFVAPTAFALELLMLWTDKSLHPTFGIATLAGIVVGAALVARLGGAFRWEGFASTEDLKTQILGAVLMGFGGVTALGCTVGQGLTGVSTLAIGSFIALAGLVIGCVATLKYLLWKAERE